MNKKIASEIAIGIILILVIITGSLFWIQNKAQAPIKVSEINQSVSVSQIPETEPAVIDENANGQIYKNEEYGIKITFPSEMDNLEKLEQNLDSARAYNPLFEVYFAKNKNTILNGGENVILVTVFDRTKCNSTNLDSEEKSFCDFHKNDNPAGLWKTKNKNTKFLNFWVGNEKKLVSLEVAEGASDNVAKLIISKLKVELLDKSINQQISEDELKNMVSDSVNSILKIWDHKVTIDSYNVDKTAAKGKWYASDAWDWIAWQQENGQWAVFANFEGATKNDCDFLKTTPDKYRTFFQDIINDQAINACFGR